MLHRGNGPRRAAATWQKGFLAMLPVIRTHTRIAFRDLDAEAREEAVQEAICNAMVAYQRLFRLGKTDVAYPSALARFAVAQVRSLRKVGGRQNCRDVASRHCQRRHGIVVERLDRFDSNEEIWREVLVEDKRAGPAETAAARLDFGVWLGGLPGRLIRLASFLASGETTNAAARKFRVSAGRISQLRGELQRSWHVFQNGANGEPPAAETA